MNETFRHPPQNRQAREVKKRFPLTENDQNSAVSRDNFTASWRNIKSGNSFMQRPRNLCGDQFSVTQCNKSAVKMSVESVFRSIENSSIHFFNTIELSGKA